MSKGSCVVIVGSQWGDEGKGKIVDVLAEQIDIVARYQGGANAGHTVHVGSDEFILHQIPSGILHPGRTCLLGNGVVFDPFQFFEELDEIKAKVPDAERRVGVSGRGIGPAYEDKVARQGIRVADLRDAARAETLLRRAAERINRKLEMLDSGEKVDADLLVRDVMTIRERLLALMVDTGRAIQDALNGGKRVLLEGAQGALLDVDHGTYPYVTSSNTTAGGAGLGVGIGPTMIDDVVGVVKAYTTRVGEGPLPTEFPSPLQEEIREKGGEFGATTGRPRRCGWFDAVVVRYAALVNGLTGLAVTKLDVLDGLPELKIATHYTAAGETLDDFPGDLALLAEAVPQYETLPGWTEKTSTARTWEDLPAAAHAYLRRLEALTGVPIWYVSVGTRRDQIIHVAR